MSFNFFHVSPMNFLGTLRDTYFFLNHDFLNLNDYKVENYVSWYNVEFSVAFYTILLIVEKTSESNFNLVGSSTSLKILKRKKGFPS